MAGAVLRVSFDPDAGRSTKTPIAKWFHRERQLSIRITSASATGLITGGMKSGPAISVVVFGEMETSAIPGMLGADIALTATSVASNFVEFALDEILEDMRELRWRSD